LSINGWIIIVIYDLIALMQFDGHESLVKKFLLTWVHLLLSGVESVY
jgi:hypothetical protein